MFHSDKPGILGARTEPTRSRLARAMAERALVRIVHHYGKRPEFVVLGGLVPELLCSESEYQHAGTVDVDVQADLEIACGSVNARRLERALHNAEFVPEEGRIWRWVSVAGGNVTSTVKFELLADHGGEAAEATIKFDECKSLGAVNLRGTGFASRDVEVRELSARIGGVVHRVEINVSGLAGFLLAKVAAAFSRRKDKDWYDIAFVLLHNDAGQPGEVARLVRERFSDEIDTLRSAINDLHNNFAVLDAQGVRAYTRQMRLDYPELDPKTLAADALLAIEEFCRDLQN